MDVPQFGYDPYGGFVQANVFEEREQFKNKQIQRLNDMLQVV